MMPKIPKFLQRNLNAAYYHMCRLGTPLPVEAERMLRDGLHRWAETVLVQRAASRKDRKSKIQANRLPQMRKELSMLREAIERHKKPSHARTERQFDRLSEYTKAILNAAFKSRMYSQVEDFVQIDLANPAHRQTLLDAIKGMRCSLDEFDDPKFNQALDTAFYCLADVFEATTGQPARLSATYDNLAKSSYDKAVLATYRMGKPLGDYQTQDFKGKKLIVREKAKFKVAAQAYDTAMGRRP
jgi:hypothetical protein